jgi:hypothetical protein
VSLGAAGLRLTSLFTQEQLEQAAH